MKKKTILLIIIFTVTLCLTPIFNIFINGNELLGFNTVSNARSQYFRVQGTKIISPQGKQFIPIGANINGWNFMGWDAKELGGAAKLVNSIQNDWNFNIVRATVGLKEQVWQGQLKQALSS
ncbi:MAG: hypothetical protein KI793_26735 [Rivularia sp. (in: Bacteria)]|nr:hypothetical protein [Rivularia sp. MS3]